MVEKHEYERWQIAWCLLAYQILDHINEWIELIETSETSFSYLDHAWLVDLDIFTIYGCDFPTNRSEWSSELCLRVSGIQVNCETFIGSVYHLAQKQKNLGEISKVNSGCTGWTSNIFLAPRLEADTWHNICFP
jgi:hypothetical protein